MMSDIKPKRGRPFKKKALEFTGNADTGEIGVVEVEVEVMDTDATPVTFLSMRRDQGGYQVLEIEVDLKTNKIVKKIDHEPTMKAIAEDLFKIEVVKKIWAKTD